LVAGINNFALDKNKLKGQDIFKIPNANFRYTFFGDNFKELVLKNNLKGVHFNRYEKITIE
jgi:hypothetical protein